MDRLVGPPPGTDQVIGSVAEEYRNRFTPWNAKRWWLDPKVLVGGSIQDAADFERMRTLFGVTHALSVESERSDWGKVPMEQLCYLPTADDGSPQPAEMIRRAAEWGREVLLSKTGNPILYVHCQQGVSRSPSYAYAVLRLTYGLDRAGFLRRIRLLMADWGMHPYHAVYMTSVEDAIPLKVPGAAKPA